MHERFAAAAALLPAYLSQHVLLSLSALILGFAISLPLAVAATRNASIRWVKERSGAATDFGNGSLTGGMGGDYTSWTGPIKANDPNFARPQLELEHCRASLR